jgi:hypothetical protein
MSWQRRLSRGVATTGTAARADRRSAVRELILRRARKNPSWGYLRIVGELRKLAIGVSTTSIRNILIKAECHRLRSATRSRGPASCECRPSRPSAAS